MKTLYKNNNVSMGNLMQGLVGFSGNRAFSTNWTPVKVYANADLQKQEILEENKGKSGIYMWNNLLTGKIYVGSAQNIKRRLTSYYTISFLEQETSMYICRSLLKHGYSSFGLSILEYCSVENLVQREQYYIDTLKPGYNICKTAGSTLGKAHSEDTKGRISVSKKGTYQGENNSFFGGVHSEESRKRMSEIKLGTTLSDIIKAKISASKRGKKFTEEHTANLSASQPSSKKISVLDIETDIETTYNSIAAASKALGLPDSSIRSNLKSKNETPFRGRYIFKLIN